MNETHGIYSDGQVKLDSTVDWPDGTPVTVQPKSGVVQAPPVEAWRESWGIEDDYAIVCWRMG